MNLELANRFVALRKQRGYSQETLAEKLGVSRQAVSKWERGESSPDTDNLIALANIYEISLDELLKGDDPARSEACREEELAPGNGQEDGLHLTSTAGEEVCLGPEGIYAKDEAGDSIELKKGSHSVYIVKDGQRYTLPRSTKKVAAFAQPYLFFAAAARNFYISFSRQCLGRLASALDCFFAGADPHQAYKDHTNA